MVPPNATAAALAGAAGLTVEGVVERIEKPRGADSPWRIVLSDGKATIQIVYFKAAEQDRTYHSALAFKQWLAEHGQSPASFDVVTLGPHARRSRLLAA